MNHLKQPFSVDVARKVFPSNDDSGDDFDGPEFASIIDPDSNDFASVAQLQASIAAGDLTSVGLVTRALARIAALNEQGPQLRAVIETNPDALSIAQAMDAEAAAGNLRGPLHGIPVLIKDNIDSGDTLQTSAGSLALVGEPAPADAYVVQRLRAAGAVILGKANTSEWMGFRDWKVPLGWSGRGGQTQSAVGKGMQVFGSSAGSAVAVKAGFVSIAVGTETNGSLVGPAYFSQVVGMRPTFGLLSQSGLIPLSSSMDTPGPMARSITDAALLLDAMFGVDAPGTSLEGAPEEPIDYASNLDAQALNGARLGYPSVARDGTPMLDNPDFAHVAARLEQAGAVLVPVEFEFPNVFPDLLTLVNYDFKRDLAQYLDGRPGIAVKTLADVIEFNQQNPVSEAYGQGLLEGAEALEFDEDAYTAVVSRVRTQSRALIDNALTAHELAALIDLPMGPLTGFGAQAGYPGLLVPSGLSGSGTPTGLYLTGTKWTDQALLSLGYAFEQCEV